MSKPTSVRLSDEILARLDFCVEKMHLGDRATVIKLCLFSFLEYFEKHGAAVLPLDWDQILQEMDGRTTKGKAKSSRAMTYDRAIHPPGLIAADHSADYNHGGNGDEGGQMDV